MEDPIGEGRILTGSSVDCTRMVVKQALILGFASTPSMPIIELGGTIADFSLDFQNIILTQMRIINGYG